MTSALASIHVSMSKLSEHQFNWDNNGGLPIRPDVYTFAKYRLFPNANRVFLEGVPEPRAVLEQDGTVCFEFKSEDGQRTVELLILCEGVVEYGRFSESGSTISGTARVTPEDQSGITEINDALYWLVHGKTA